MRRKGGGVGYGGYGWTPTIEEANHPDSGIYLICLGINLNKSNMENNKSWLPLNKECCRHDR